MHWPCMQWHWPCTGHARARISSLHDSKSTSRHYVMSQSKLRYVSVLSAANRQSSTFVETLQPDHGSSTRYVSDRGCPLGGIASYGEQWQRITWRQQAVMHTAAVRHCMTGHGWTHHQRGLQAHAVAEKSKSELYCCSVLFCPAIPRPGTLGSCCTPPPRRRQP